MDTVLEVLKVTVQKAKKLFLEEVDIVFDHAIYSKALEIIMNPVHEDLHAFCNIRMGPFHVIMAFLAVIGLLFGGSGLRDLAIESGVIQEGSLKAVLSGKAYNSALRLHKCIYETTVRKKSMLMKNGLETMATMKFLQHSLGQLSFNNFLTVHQQRACSSA